MLNDMFFEGRKTKIIVKIGNLNPVTVRSLLKRSKICINLLSLVASLIIV